MSYFTNSHPKHECGECRGCPASSYHRGKCADRMYVQDEIDMMDEMERCWLFEQHMEKEAEYLSSTQVEGIENDAT